MQDPGQSSGRDKKGRFAPGHSGNPHGRKGNVRTDSDGGPRFDALPGQHIDPGRVNEIIRVDGWQNVSTGVGIPGFDKSINTRFITDIFTREHLVELWRGDDIAAQAIECLPSEALKKKWELNIADEGQYGDLKDQIEQLVDDLELNEKLLQALTMERGFGGSALLIGANDGQDMSMPLNMDTIIDLMYVTPLEPDELSPLTPYSDPMHPKYGKTELWQIHASAQASVGLGDPLQRTLPKQTVIHETRLIIFPGIRVSKNQNRSSVMGAAWGDSVLNRVANIIANFHLGYANTGIILTEQGLPIFHMKELAKLVNSNRVDIVKARLSLLFQQMSTARAAVIDSEENYERKAMPLTGLPEVLDRLAVRVAAALRMPVTKLLGQSPKGLGNEGESDMEQWYDTVATYQDSKIRRPLRRLLQVAIRALHAQEPRKWSVKFPPLKQLSDAELATARSTQATTDIAYIQAGVLLPEEVRNSRFTGEYSFETQLDDEAWNAMSQMAQQPLTPEDMMAMGLDPNNPDDVAKAQGMMGGGMGPGVPGMDPGTDPNAPPFGAEGQQGENPFAQEGQPEGEGEPSPFGEKPEGGAKPAPFGAKPPGAEKPSPFGAKPPGAEKPSPFGADEKPEGKPAAKPGDKPLAEGGKSSPFGKKPEGDEQAPEKEGDSPFANSERKPEAKPGDTKDGGRGRSGETDEDRQRQSSQRPGIPMHLRDVDGDGKVSEEEAAMSIDDILAEIEAIKQELDAGGGKAPAGKPGSPDEDVEPVDEDVEPVDEDEDKRNMFQKVK